MYILPIKNETFNHTSDAPRSANKGFSKFFIFMRKPLLHIRKMLQTVNTTQGASGSNLYLM